MLPVVRELETEYADRVDVEIVDYYADSTKPLLAQYGVRGHPSFLIFGRDGAPLALLFGPVGREPLVEQLETALA